MICALALREVETDVREDLDRGIEQRCALDALWVEHGELEDQPAAERVPDERRTAHAGRVECLEHVVRVRRDRPGRIPIRESVPAQIWCEHAKSARQPFLRQPAEASSM